MSIYDDTHEIGNRHAQLVQAGKTPVYGPKEELQHTFENAINDADMVMKLAARIKEGYNDLYKRLINPAGWDPDIPMQRGDVDAPAIKAMVDDTMKNDPTCRHIRENTERVHDAFVDTTERAYGKPRRASHRQCDDCGYCRGGDGPCKHSVDS
jgi:hypothetical protein